MHVHMCAHTHMHNLLSPFSVIHTYMCLGVTPWD